MWGGDWHRNIINNDNDHSNNRGGFFALKLTPPLPSPDSHTLRRDLSLKKCVPNNIASDMLSTGVTLAYFRSLKGS